MQRIFLPGLLLCITLFSCSKIFDIKPEDALDREQMYLNIKDADAAVIGIYGKLMGLASRYVILNEVRADLVDVPAGVTDRYLKQLSTHSVTADNPYADPRPFYEVIINCNDALQNFDRMLREKRMTTDEYNIRYSAVGAVRSWLYLELGIQFGSVPYVTDPLTNIDDLKDASKYPRISFDQLLDNLLQFTESLPYKTPFPAGTSLLTTVDAYNTEKFFINIKILLGELYLWKGNYGQAAFNYYYMMNYADILYPAKNSEQWYETYKVAWTANLNGASWANIFSQPYGERYSNYEIIWDLPFDKSFSPKNPFIDLFANAGGSYLLKPSAMAIRKWDSEIRSDNTPYDLRGNGASYKMSNGVPVISKYTYNFDITKPFETNSKWILYRAAALHLHYAEAANRDGRNKLAYALLNQSLGRTFDPEPPASSSGDQRDVSNIQQSFDSQPYYYFDGRFGAYPNYRGAWHRHTGIRGRVGLLPATIDSAKFFDMTVPERPVTDMQGLILDMENKLVKEGAQELAFEGYRWPDLLRIALRREKEHPGTGVAFLKERLAARFEAAGNTGEGAAVAAKLSDPQNWYLPFRWE